MVDLLLEGKPLSMELDTGASVTLVLEQTFQRLFGEQALDPTSIQLRTYSGEAIQVLGQVTVKVSYKQQR